MDTVNLWGNYSRQIGDLDAANTKYLPNFFGISLPKTGSTWLSYNLGCHPEIFILEGKEVVYFSNYWKLLDINWYVKHFVKCEKGIELKKGEISTSYAMLPLRAIRLIKSLMPNLKLVFLMRDPVDRAWSEAKHTYKHRELNFASYEGDFDSISDSEFIKNFTNEVAITQGDYLGALKRWTSVFPKEQFYIGFYESIKSNPKELLLDIFDHLSVTKNVDWSKFRISEKILEGIRKEIPSRFEDCLRSIWQERTMELAEFLKEEFSLDLPPKWRGTLEPRLKAIENKYKQIGAFQKDLDEQYLADILAVLDIYLGRQPLVIENDYKGFSISLYGGKFYALAHSLGGVVDFCHAEEGIIEEYKKNGEVKMCSDIEAVDIKEKQIHTDEQRVVLRTLAESVARPGCKFLEVGSWCGDSTVLLGKVVQENGGQLYCVDWWKGNVGTELTEIAGKTDVFSFFWDKICSEGLEDVIIPIRSRSDLAFDILREQTFDLIFIDADHRYEAVLNDIKRSAPLVSRKGGILCGHDCDSRISDFDRSFLEAGKDVDLFEGVHCGVVLAVGSVFNEYSLNHSIWSVRANSQSAGWEPTNLAYPGIKDKRQTPSPVFGLSKNYSFLRYGRLVYGVPCSLSGLDVTEEAEVAREEVIKAKSLKEAEEIIGERIYALPVLLGCYKNFNLLDFNGRIYALQMALEPVDLIRKDEETLIRYRQNGDCIVGESVDAVKHLIDPEYNSLKEETNRARLKNALSVKDTRIKMLDAELGALRRDLAVRGVRIEELQNNCATWDSIVKKLQTDLAERDKRIEELQNNCATWDSIVKKLQTDLAERDKRIEELQGELHRIKSGLLFHLHRLFGGRGN